MDERAQLLVRGLELARARLPVMRSAASPAHSASSSAITSNMPSEALLARPRHHGGAMRARLDQPARREQADRLAHRRARHREAARKLGLVERRRRAQHAAHDLVGELQPQLLGQRLAAAGDAARRHGAAST